MAFEFNDLKTFLFLVFFFLIPSTSSTNIDCNGKPYYCVNSTHFMICVDLGGKISTTIDDTVLACPPPTECRPSNRYECEFPINEVSTTSHPVIDETISNVKNGLPPLNVGVTTALPVEVTTNASTTETKVVMAVSEGNQLSNNTEILENLRTEYADGNDKIFEWITTTPSNNISINGELVNDTKAFSTETTTDVVKIYSTEYTKDWTTLRVTTPLPMEVTTETIINSDKTNNTESIQGVTEVLPTEVTKSLFTQTNKTELLEEIRKEFTDVKDIVFDSVNTTSSNDVSHKVDKSFDIQSPTTVTMLDAHKSFSTKSSTKEVASIYTPSPDVTTSSPTTNTTKLAPIQNETDFPVIEKIINTDKTYITKSIQGVTTVLPTEVTKSPLTKTNKTELLEEIRKEFTDGKDIVYNSINNTPPKDVSHNVDKSIDIQSPTTVTLPDADKIFNTNFITKEVSSIYTSTLDVTTNFPTEVTTKLAPIQNETDFPVLEQNKFVNKTDILEHIRKEYTDGKDMVFESINTTRPSNVSQNDTQINDTNSLLKESTLDVTTILPFKVSTKLTASTITITNTDKIQITDSTTEKGTSLYSSTSSATTVLPIEVNTILPFTQTNKTEILEDIRKEFTDSKDLVFKSTNTTPSRDVFSNIENSVSAKTPIYANTFHTDTMYSTDYTTSSIEVTTNLPQTQRGTDFPVLEKNIFVNNTDLLEHFRKVFTDSKDMVFQSVNTTPPKNINDNVEQFDESNNSNTGDKNKSTTKQLPVMNKDFIEKVMDVTISPDVFIDTEQRISLEKPPDYTNINNLPKAALPSNGENNTVQNNSMINVEQVKFVNDNKIIETESKSNNSDLFNFMDNRNIVSEEINKSINITISGPEKNVSHYTTQYEKVSENYFQTNKSQSIETYITTSPTYEPISVKINKNDSNVIERYYFNSNLESDNVTDKPVQSNVINNLNTRPVTFDIEEIYKNQEFTSTTVPNNISMTENKKNSTETVKLEYSNPIASEANKTHEKKETNIFIPLQYPINDHVENTTVIDSGIKNSTTNFSISDTSSRNIIILNNKTHINLTGIVESNNVPVDLYNTTKDMILLTSSDLPSHEIKQVTHSYSVSEIIPSVPIVTEINKVPAEELLTSNYKVMPYTEATVLFEATPKEITSIKTDTNMLSTKEVSITNGMSPVTESPGNNKGQITDNTLKSKPETDKVAYEKPLITAVNQVTIPSNARQVKGTTSFPQPEERLAELKESVSKQRFLQDVPTSQTGNNTKSPTSVVEGIFIKPIKLDSSKAPLYTTGSILITGTEVVVPDKASSIITNTNITLPANPVSENLLQEVVPEVIINKEDSSFNKSISTKNTPKTFGNATMLKAIGEKSIAEVTTEPFFNAFALKNVTQVTTMATPLSKIVPEENSVTKVVPNVTISEEKSGLVSHVSMFERGTMLSSQAKHEENSSIMVVTNTPYIRATLPVTRITKHVPFSTVASQSSLTDSSRLVATSVSPIDELSTVNTIQSTLFTSSTERQFPTIDYINNEKTSTPNEFGPVDNHSVIYGNFSNEKNTRLTNTASDLATTSIVVTTESMQPSHLESTVASNSNKKPSTIRDLNLKQNTPMSPTYGLDRFVVPTFSAKNIDTTNIYTDSKFTAPVETAIIKHTTESNTLIFKISSTTRKSIDEFNKYFTTESLQTTSSTVTSADNTLKNVPFDIATEPSSVVEMINVATTKNKKEVVDPKMINEKDNTELTSQYGKQFIKQTTLNTKTQSMTVNSKELNSKAHIKMTIDSSLVPKMKVNDQDGEIDEEDQPATKYYETTTTSRTITSSIDNLTKSYKKRDIANIEHVSDLSKGPNTNVEHIEMPELRKTYVKETTSSSIYKLPVQASESNAPTISTPKKENTPNSKLKVVTNSIQNQPHTTSKPLYHSISYTQPQKTTNNLKSPIPSTTDRTNSKENLNKVAFKCLNHSLGKYADNTDCRKFYICVGTLQPIVGTCPNNTVFSEINRHCTKNLSHCVRKNQFHCLYEGRFVDFTKDNIYFICVKNNLHGFIRYKLQCLKGYHVNKVSVKCEKDIDLSESASEVSEPEANSDQNGSSKREESEVSEKEKYLECKKEGNFPYPKDCRKYFECSKNKNGEYRRKIKSCAAEKRYDKGKNKCVVADSSDEC